MIRVRVYSSQEQAFVKVIDIVRRRRFTAESVRS